MVMKKLAAIMAAVMVFTGMSLSVEAATSVTVVVDGRVVEFPDAPAYIDSNDRTQVPVSFVAKAMGMYVEWEGKANQATFVRASQLWKEPAITTVKFRVGSADYYVKNGDGASEKRTMDTKAVNEQSRVYVPLKYLAEAFGAKVTWDQKTRTATITSATKSIGGFSVPQSYTDDVTKVDANGTKYTQFGLNDLTGKMSAAREDKSEILMQVLSQKLSADSIVKLRKFIADNYDFKPKSIQDFKIEKFTDSNTGGYVEIYRKTVPAPVYIVLVYDKGAKPLN